jgi:ParB-like nuclease domain
MSELAVHPVAALFPMLADDELDELAASIKANGLLQPIVIDTEGAILDGRHRFKACQKADVKPRFETYKGRCHVCGFYLSIARGRCLKHNGFAPKSSSAIGRHRPLSPACAATSSPGVRPYPEG